jgi:hypothetical protein
LRGRVEHGPAVALVEEQQPKGFFDVEILGLEGGGVLYQLPPLLLEEVEQATDPRFRGR